MALVKKIVEAYRWGVVLSVGGWLFYLAAGWLPLDTVIDRLVIGASIVWLVTSFYEVLKIQRKGERAAQNKRQAAPPEVKQVEQISSQNQGK